MRFTYIIGPKTRRNETPETDASNYDGLIIGDTLPKKKLPTLLQKNTRMNFVQGNEGGYAK